MSPRWAVVIPVKPAALGKSRLEVPGVARDDLARAIALDTIAAVAACELVAGVYVVTDDPALPLQAAGIRGLRWVHEAAAREQRAADVVSGRASVVAGAGLDGAIALGMDEIGDGMPRAALLGDLPSLRPGDLADALRAAAAVERAVVADAEGTGSTMVTAGRGIRWSSAFGPGSFEKHVTLGCVALEVPAASSLRRDVDTVDQLQDAARRGLGPRTAALLGSA